MCCWPRRSPKPTGSPSCTSRCASKTRLAALRVKDFSKRDVMVIHTLLWPDEIRDPDFPVLDTKVEIKPAELKMAGQVVDSMAEDFEPDQFHDDYQEQLQGADRGETRRRRGVHRRGEAHRTRRDRGRLGSVGQTRGQREEAPGLSRSGRRG